MFVPVCACEEELLGPRKVWSAFVGPGVRICDGDRIVEKNFRGPGKFCRLSWDQGVHTQTRTGFLAYRLTHPLWRASYADVWQLLLCCAEMNKNMLRTTGCPPDMCCHKGGRRLLPIIATRWLEPSERGNLCSLQAPYLAVALFWRHCLLHFTWQLR